jgi:hypothetical protein
MSSTALKTCLGVTVYDEKKAYNGYTLFSPVWGKYSIIIDMKGDIVHMWEFNKRPGDLACPLPDGDLLYPERFPPTRMLHMGGVGNDTLIVDWDNNLKYKYPDPESHHVVKKLSNGNIMYIRDMPLPPDMAKKVKGGIPDTEENGTIYGSCLREVDPEGNVVWEWLPWEHLDFDIFSICIYEERVDWNHANTCMELPNGDILTCFRTNDIAAIIDKKTKKVKWHWGKGEIKHPHMPNLTKDGNILIFDNGIHRENAIMAYSRVVEVNPETDEIVWEYKEDYPANFYSGVMCGAFRLPNNNTLIVENTKGRIFEVTYDKEIVWEYMSPFYFKPNLETLPGVLSWIHRAYRHAPDDEFIKGKDLNPDKYKAWNFIYGSGAF